jgi:hypothetical protein
MRCPVYESTRSFQIWDYNVSHKQLLIRSPRTNGESDNVDIVFWGVEYIAISTLIDGLTLTRLTPSEAVRCFAAEFNSQSVPTFKIGSSGFVIASGCKVLVNQLEIFDSSLVYPDRDRPQEEYGDMVAKL